MSLIRVRRQRKKAWLDARKGTSVRRLVLALIAVSFVIWYLSVRF